MSAAEIICLKHFVLSANSSIWDVMTDGKSLMNPKKEGDPVCYPGVLHRTRVEY